MGLKLGAPNGARKQERPQCLCFSLAGSRLSLAELAQVYTCVTVIGVLTRLLTHREVEPGGARDSALVTESGALPT